MSGSEGNTFHDKEIREVRRAHEGIRGSFLRAIGLDGDGSHSQAQDGQAKANILECFEKGFLVFLEILVVSGRQTFHEREEAG